MRYFCNGNRVVRVLTDASLGSDEFRNAVAQVFHMKRETFVDRPEMIDEIIYTGDWNPCSEVQAMDLIQKRCNATTAR